MATTKTMAKEAANTKDTEASKVTAAAKAAPTAKKSAKSKASVTKTTAAKTTAKKTKKPTEKVDVFIEFGGKAVALDDIVNNVKITNQKPANNYTIYVKPEESKAYFVADGEEKEMDVFFC